MWGQVFNGVLVLKRIIPMRVGTSFTGNTWTANTMDHPHACGDKLIMLNGAMAKLGSSPCVWGQVYHRSGYSSVDRIIPMRVGTRNFLTQRAQVSQDHPHACGDKLKYAVRNGKIIGSSPCVWGQVYHRSGYSSVDRIIPMRVGTSLRT